MSWVREGGYRGNGEEGGEILEGKEYNSHTYIHARSLARQATNQPTSQPANQPSRHSIPPSRLSSSLGRYCSPPQIIRPASLPSTVAFTHVRTRCGKGRPSCVRLSKHTDECICMRAFFLYRVIPMGGRDGYIKGNGDVGNKNEEGEARQRLSLARGRTRLRLSDVTDESGEIVSKVTKMRTISCVLLWYFPQWR